MIDRRARRTPTLLRFWLVCSVLLVASCTTTADGEAQDDSTTTTAEIIPEQPVSPEQEAIVALSGQLAVVDVHELSVMQPDGTGATIVGGSEDASTVASQPSWSPDGSRLAWVLTDGPQSSKISAGAPGAEPLVSEPIETPPFYLSWDTAGTTLSYLRSERDGPRFEFGTLEPGESAVAGEIGAPLFSSWRPDTVEVALHVDGDRLGLLEPGSVAIPIGSSTGQFATPAWRDEDRLLIVEGGKLVSLDVETNERRELLDIGEASRFVLSPDRSRLAYLTVETGTQTVSLPARQPSLPTDVSLRVFDFTTGRDRLVTDEPVVAFEWSPNSALLGWLGRVDQSRMQWHLWSSAGELDALSPYEPSGLDQSAYLPFFDQYAQSQNRWDPDAQAMVFAGTIDGIDGVWVELIEGGFGPFRVADGQYATWSPPPGGGGGASVL